ncbi:MAG TPA: endopeptidase La [Bacteroidia bacterium]|jgi:ATP-dependent Lon protease|nr:endopeptidase La [Bacteroidia bacterium]
MRDPSEKTPLEQILRVEAVNDDPEFIPLLTHEEEKKINSEKIPDEIPILPLRNTVLFPGVVIPITVSREKSIRLIKEAYAGDKTIGVVAQKNDGIEDPGIDDIHWIGTIAHILKTLKMPDGSTTAIIQGKRRFEITELSQKEPYLKAKVKAFEEIHPAADDREYEAMVSSLKDVALQIIKQSPHIPSETGFAIRNIESSTFLINFISSNMSSSVAEKQRVLQMADLKERTTALLGLLNKELQMLKLKNQIQSKVKEDIDKQQREYFLHQQLKTIQEELGGDTFDQQIKEYREKAKTKKWAKNIKDAFEKDLQKLERMNPNAAEYSVQSNYLELLLELPWNEFTADNFDLKRAEKILNHDHYGLEKIKQRILEYLAVIKLKGDMKAPILCLAGPPGVGKTSLGRSIANSLGRKYVRISLGGMHDEAEIRGHRKTYIGAMPGRIIQSLKKAKTSNPVFVLDEIDKIGRDFHGDPASALLEVLDPEQNKEFHDNFIEVEYDLSKVLFIATANNLGAINPALLDRMEIIEITGYTVEEKIEIAKRHLIPKQLKEHGMKKDQVTLSPKLLEAVIEDYTRESGVRNLEKKIAQIIRYAAKSVAMEEKYNPEIKKEQLDKILSPAHPKERYQGNDVAGVVTGLAWTPTGGDILFIEVSLSRGKGGLTLTGNLGDVMKESATLALEYLKSHAEKWGIPHKAFEKWNVHIHVPEGATPKDGPSAGIAMLTALASAYTQRKVRKNLAMTGEITLRGSVLPVGGLKEKILAAKRAGITEIILSASNKRDIDDINQKYLKDLKFKYVDKMDEVLAHALLSEVVKNPLKLDAAFISDDVSKQN